MDELHIDSDTLQAVLEMQLQDITAMLLSSKGKQRQGEVRDFDLALDCYKAELESQLLLLHDRMMCKSIASAVCIDAGVISELVAQEEQASRDRELALRSTNGEVPVESATDLATKEPDLDVDFLSKLEKLYVSPIDLEERIFWPG